MIFTHARDDLHQDHRPACELTWNTFRDHLILEYEIPKYDGDLGQSESFRARSRGARAREGPAPRGRLSQPAWQAVVRCGDFLGLMRLRGMEAGATTGYAEAFTVRKLGVAFW